jgi:hypothetical protein
VFFGVVVIGLLLLSSQLRVIENFHKSTHVAFSAIAFLALTSASTLTLTDSPAAIDTFEIESDQDNVPFLSLTSATSFPSIYR